MKNRVALICGVLFVILALGACGSVTSPALTVEEQAAALAKTQLQAEAKEWRAEVSQIKATTTASLLSPAATANGIEALIEVRLDFAWRCADTVTLGTTWRDAVGWDYLTRTRGQWEHRLLGETLWRTGGGGQSYGPPRCASSVPKEWSDQMLSRRWEEKFGVNFPEYAATGRLYYNPLEINDVSVVNWTTEIGPTWMFVPAGKSVLKQCFGRDFTDEEIEAYRTDPRRGEEMVTILDGLAKEGKIRPEVAEFYRKALTYEGRRDIYCAYWQQHQPGWHCPEGW